MPGLGVGKILPALLLWLTAPFGLQAEELRILNWADYFAPEVLAGFAAETGIKPVVSVYTENDVGEAILLATQDAYDLAVTSLDALDRLRAAGVIAPLSGLGLASDGVTDPALRSRMAALDADYAAYAVLYLWGHTGLVFDRQKVEARIPDAPLDSWDLVFDPDYLAALSDCGVGIVDSPEEVLSAALLYLGHDPRSHDPAQLDQAFAVVRDMLPYLSHFDSTHFDALSRNELCLALTWTTEGVAAELEFVASPYSFVAPQEGSSLWFDVFVRPADGRNPEAVRRFLEYVTRPENVALSVEWNYASPGDPAIKARVWDELAEHPAVFAAPSDAGFYVLDALDSDEKTALDRRWRDLMLGR